MTPREHSEITWLRTENAGMGNGLYPIRLIGAAISGFYRTCFNKEPTLLQARTKLESAFTADNRLFFDWVVCRDEPHDFLGRPEP